MLLLEKFCCKMSVEDEEEVDAEPDEPDIEVDVDEEIELRPPLLFVFGFTMLNDESLSV